MDRTALGCGMITQGKEQQVPTPADRGNENDVDQ